MNNICKSCKKPLSEGYKGKICERCKGIKAQKVKKFIGGGALLALVFTIFRPRKH